MIPILRAFRLGRAILALENVERQGGAVMLHSSFCAGAGSGWWIALVRPPGWRGCALGRPVVGRDLLQVLELAQSGGATALPC